MNGAGGRWQRSPQRPTGPPKAHDPIKIRYSLFIVVFCAALAAISLLSIVRPIYRQKQTDAAQWQ
jgi:hypothetical protein